MTSKIHSLVDRRQSGRRSCSENNVSDDSRDREGERWRSANEGAKGRKTHATFTRGIVRERP